MQVNECWIKGFSVDKLNVWLLCQFALAQRVSIPYAPSTYFEGENVQFQFRSSDGSLDVVSFSQSSTSTSPRSYGFCFFKHREKGLILNGLRIERTRYEFTEDGQLASSCSFAGDQSSWIGRHPVAQCRALSSSNVWERTSLKWKFGKETEPVVWDDYMLEHFAK